MEPDFSKSPKSVSRRELLASMAALPLVAQDASLAARSPRPEHGLMFRTPVAVWDEALPLGNGAVGALLWGDGAPIRISLDRADLWDLRPVPEFHSPEYRYEIMQQWHREGKVKDLLRVYEEPYNRPAPTKIPAGRIEVSLDPKPQFVETGLSLADALASMRFGGGVEFEVFVHAVEPVGLARLRNGAGISLRLVAPAFGGATRDGATNQVNTASVSRLGYAPPERSEGPGWQAYSQKGAEGFHFAVYTAWRQKDGAWEAAWSVASSFESPDPLALARDRVTKTLDSGFEQMLATHRKWWTGYWQQSSVRLPNPVVERQWYLEQYKFGAASRRGAPPISLQAIWTADDGKLPPWKGDFHHDLNTQLSYWPCYSGNHLEEGLAYLDWLWSVRPACVAWTKRFFDLPGLNVPMTSDLAGEQIGGWRQYTHSVTTAAWLSQHFYLHWKYSADRSFLEQRAYPYLRDSAIFVEAVSAKKGADGYRTIPLSASPEINDNRPSAWFDTVTNYDLSLMRWLLGASAELAAGLRLDDEARRWRRVLAEMPPFSFGDDGRLLIAKGYPLPASHRHFSHLMAIHPLGIIDPADGADARRTIDASLAELDKKGSDYWCGYSFSWLANLQARAGNGAGAEKSLEIFSTAFTLRNSFHCNGDQSGKGYSKFKYRPFTLEGNFAAAAGVQEMLLRSHHGIVEIFPAIPPAWKDVSFTTLRAEGAFLISAERRGGTVRRIEILSEKGGTLKMMSPFSGRALSIALSPGERRTLESDPA
jgi:alpha-L-fucosidase 2